MPNQFVSIQADNGQIVTVAASWAKARKLTVLKDEPAVDRFGVPLSPRKATGAAPAKKAAAKKAKKATARKRASKRTTSKSSESSTSGNTGMVAAATPEEASK